MVLMYFVGGGGSCTLGSNAGNGMCVGDVVGCTLRDAAALVSEGYSRIVCIRFNCVASVKSAFLTGSPACKLGVVVDGGSVNIDTMSPAACFR